MLTVATGFWGGAWLADQLLYLRTFTSSRPYMRGKEYDLLIIELYLVRKP